MAFQPTLQSTSGQANHQSLKEHLFIILIYTFKMRQKTEFIPISL